MKYRMRQTTFITIFAIVCGIVAFIVYPSINKPEGEFNSFVDMGVYVALKFKMQTPLNLGPVSIDRTTHVEGWGVPGLASKAEVTYEDIISFIITDKNNKSVLIKYKDSGPGKKLVLLSSVKY
jgi:hypothetical protein